MIRQFKGPNRFLSNFYPAKVTLDNVEFPTVEHAFQAAKTLNSTERAWVLSAPSPGNAKQRGRQVALRPDWEEVKIQIMEALLVQKFSDPELKAKLLDTGDFELVEGNTWNDRFWGVDLRTMEGRNELGKALMRVREGK